MNVFYSVVANRHYPLLLAIVIFNLTPLHS
jgi:hypothetical protein